MSEKKLYRSREDAMIGGVCGGMAEYFAIDASLVRLAAILLVFAAGLSFWVYIVAWIIVPQRQLGDSLAAESGAGNDTEGSQSLTEPESSGEANDKSKMIIGVILIALGLVFLLNTFNIFVWFSFFKLWPVVIIVIGVLILIKSLDRRSDNES